MLPNIDIQVHDLLLRVFYFPKQYGPQEKLDKDIADLRDFYKVNGDKILRLIVKYTGFDWAGSNIPVYLIPDNPAVIYSYTRFNLEDGRPGIILKVGKGIRDHWICIHELVHINQKHGGFYKEKGYAWGPDGKRNEDFLETTADIVTLYILRDLFGNNSDYEKDFFDFLHNTNEKNLRKYQVLNEYLGKWDLQSKNIREYLENS